MGQSQWNHGRRVTNISEMIVSTLVLLVSLKFVLSLDGCWEPLGLEDWRIGDSQIRASSSYSPESVGPSAGRLNSEKGGGAWCPKNLITENMDTQEFLEIDLEYNHVITAVVTQGRFASGRGAEFAEFYIVQYWREGLEAFQDYLNNDGEKILEGNKNTFSESKILLDTPIVASKIRIIPFSQHPRTVCMRVELLGCFEETAVEKKSKEIVKTSKQTEAPAYDTTENVINSLVIVNNGWGPHYLGAVVGLLLTVILILVILIIIILRRTIKRKQFSSNTNISFTSSLAGDGTIYRQNIEANLQIGEDPIYQEPFVTRKDISACQSSIPNCSLYGHNAGHLDQIYSLPLFHQVNPDSQEFFNFYGHQENSSPATPTFPSPAAWPEMGQFTDKILKLTCRLEKTQFTRSLL